MVGLLWQKVSHVDGVSRLIEPNDRQTEPRKRLASSEVYGEHGETARSRKSTRSSGKAKEARVERYAVKEGDGGWHNFISVQEERFPE